MFTDVDIFSDLLDAAQRHVPVYILLDEQNSNHFVSMVTSCKVNLDMVHVRPVCLPVIDITFIIHWIVFVTLIIHIYGLYIMHWHPVEYVTDDAGENCCWHYIFLSHRKII